LEIAEKGGSLPESGRGKNSPRVQKGNIRGTGKHETRQTQCKRASRGTGGFQKISNGVGEKSSRPAAGK